LITYFAKSADHLSRESPNYKYGINLVIFIVLGSPQTRWASIAFGAGVGIGSAYTECSRLFDGSPAKLAQHKDSEVAQPKASEAPTQVGFVFYSLVYIYMYIYIWVMLTSILSAFVKEIKSSRFALDSTIF